MYESAKQMVKTCGHGIFLSESKCFMKGVKGSLGSISRSAISEVSPKTIKTQWIKSHDHTYFEGLKEP